MQFHALLKIFIQINNTKTVYITFWSIEMRAKIESKIYQIESNQFQGVYKIVFTIKWHCDAYKQYMKSIESNQSQFFLEKNKTKTNQNVHTVYHNRKYVKSMLGNM